MKVSSVIKSQSVLYDFLRIANSFIMDLCMSSSNFSRYFSFIEGEGLLSLGTGGDEGWWSCLTGETNCVSWLDLLVVEGMSYCVPCRI